MDFPVEYFRPEVRSGFYVDGMMKRAWAAQLEILIEVFDKVCRENDIMWYADAGTLLGAVRHHGFIPWDDDIDVVMLRDDYIRFKKIMNTAFPEGYFCLANDQKDPRFKNEDTLSRVLNNPIISVKPEFLHIYHDFPYPAGIDIFPLDFVPDDPDEQEQFKIVAGMLSEVSEVQDSLEEIKEPFIKELIDDVELVTGYKYNKNESIEDQTYRLLEAVWGMYKRDECSHVVFMYYWLDNRGHFYEKDWFLHPQWIPFENTKVCVSGDPAAQLVQEYGPGYMNQNRYFPAHDYPFFDQFENDFIKMVGYDPFYYHYDSTLINDLKNAYEDKKLNDRNIVFVMTRGDDWKYVKEYYDSLKKENTVSVMPVPYYDCDFLRNPVLKNFNPDEYPDDVEMLDYMTTDLASMHPDEIVITFPYDQYNYSEMIDEKYFASKLKDCTDRLTYISPIETDDTQAMSPRDQKAMKHYVMVPGVLQSDRVYVQSDNMKEAYITRLIASWTEDTEKNPELKDMISEKELREIFSKKIQIRG